MSKFLSQMGYGFSSEIVKTKQGRVRQFAKFADCNDFLKGKHIPDARGKIDLADRRMVGQVGMRLKHSFLHY